MARILVIGGTRFIGRHVVRELLDAGHNVTLLNRGKTAPQLFSSLPQILADRESEDFENNREVLQNWDGVIDLCAYFPKDVANTTSLLKGYAGRYILCSTLSAYEACGSDRAIPVLFEDFPLCECDSEQARDKSDSTYGRRKAECERVAMAQHQDGIPTIILRPSLVYGEFDHSDRFAYWVWKASRNESFILPDDGLLITQLTYAPDLAKAFALSVTSSIALGNAYNIAEPDPFSLRDTLRLLGSYLKTDPLENAVSITSEFLLKEGIKPWEELPLWLPKTHLMLDTFKARRDFNLVYTSSVQAISESATAFLSEKRAPKVGLLPEVEKGLIEKFKNVIAL